MSKKSPLDQWDRDLLNELVEWWEIENAAWPTIDPSSWITLIAEGLVTDLHDGQYAVLPTERGIAFSHRTRAARKGHKPKT